MYFIELKRHVINETGNMLVSSNIPFSVNSKQDFLAFAEKIWDNWELNMIGTTNPRNWSDILQAEDDVVMKMLKSSDILKRK